jgi:hypothetical protein
LSWRPRRAKRRAWRPRGVSWPCRPPDRIDVLLGAHCSRPLHRAEPSRTSARARHVGDRLSRRSQVAQPVAPFVVSPWHPSLWAWTSTRSSAISSLTAIPSNDRALRSLGPCAFTRRR